MAAHDTSLAATVGGILDAHGPALPAAPTSLAPGDISVHFFLELGLILVACRVVGWIGRRFVGQPQVVGEMIAGVVLGPSLFGLVLPHLQAAVFPPGTRGLLYALAQFGVGLYMMLVGSTFDLRVARRRARAATAVALAGVAVPFAVAVPLAPLVLAVPGLFAAGVDRVGATLFLGAGIALTAFPMLARIVHERGLADHAVGTLALAAGAIDDVASWGVLAVVLVLFGTGAANAWLTIGGGLAFAVAAVVAGPRLLRPLATKMARDGELRPPALAAVLALFCAAAFLMDAIGIHAVFGGFVLGVILPRGPLTTALRQQVEPLTTVLLLPVFFVYSGLNTRLDLIAAPQLLALAGLLIVAATAAKGLACAVAARLAGEDWRTAAGIGALMNARGLMELIIANIGLQAGIIGPGLFAILVVLAVVTTLTAIPVFDRVAGRTLLDSPA